ncbi:MAG: single-stranded-DNA-specific exonuclease RecJ [Bacteroidales bacterium]|nr:single-stranded-DNA-specific exonuclease RecJ [Bacteroidales bacterium]
MEKRWNIKPQPDLSERQLFAKKYNIDPVLAQLLMQRGIGEDEVKTFFHSDPIRNMHNPLLMKDMQEAVDRIIKARDCHERILVYGDYDVDGTTAVSLVYQYLTRYIDEEYLDYYIPDRYNEGYGISFKGIDYAKANGVSLVIALDCGIKAVEKVRYASELGIDFIICDHHMPGDELPHAVACLDPKRSDCSYPDKNLSGCGVGFKLMQALCRLTNGNENELLEYLDLLVVSIASDIVPMIGENRILAHHGLKRLNTQPSVGLKAIIDVSVKRAEGSTEPVDISISDIVFKIGPRINAVGRLHTGKEAVDLLICRDEAKAIELAKGMGNTNEERKELDRSITEEAKKMIESNEALKNRRSTVIFNPTWHKGVIGIVASRMTEDYYRPTIILTESNGFATGSARSVDGFDLYKAIDSCSDLLENFGGHMYAAGLTMKKENVEKFSERFEAYVAENILPEQLVPQIDVDAEIPLAMITKEFYEQLERLEPFGPCNMKPVFMTRGVCSYSNPNGQSSKGTKPVGTDNRHLKLEIIDRTDRKSKSGIAFGLGSYYDKIKDGQPFDICYTIEKNVFRGQTTLQLMVRDIHLNTDGGGCDSQKKTLVSKG